MKKVGYFLFSIVFKIISFLRTLGIVKLNKKKAFFVMTHEPGPTGNLGIIRKELLSRNYEVIALTRKDEQKRFATLVRFFFVFPFHLATSKYVFMDNVFLPMAYFRMKADTVVCQLWHGTGTIKKFGQDVNTGKLGDLERKANRNITHLFVGSEYYRKLYAGCFALPKEKIFVTGLPRTDVFFDQNEVERLRSEFFEDYPELKGKKLLIYAPTFRDNTNEANKIKADLKYLSKNLRDDFAVVLHLHPFVRGLVKASEVEKKDRVYDLSGYNNLNALLVAADGLVTDYSSIIFEYMLTEKPMYFYAYDLKEFSNNGRGFYRDYEKHMPGPVVKTVEDLCEAINNSLNNDISEEIRERRESLFTETFKYADSKSTDRIFMTIGLEK